MKNMIPEIRLKYTNRKMSKQRTKMYYCFNRISITASITTAYALSM